VSCPQEKEPDWMKEFENPGILFSQCKEYVKKKFGENLKYFNPTEAANDIYQTAELLKQEEDEKIVIYGVSYGAFLMNRYMQIFPNSKHLIILDGSNQKNFQN
jgi:dienelactone hydrolase